MSRSVVSSSLRDFLSFKNLLGSLKWRGMKLGEPALLPLAAREESLPEDYDASLRAAEIAMRGMHSAYVRGENRALLDGTVHTRLAPGTSSPVSYQVKRVADGSTVYSWGLDVPLDVARIADMCTPSGFGDLETQTTRVDPGVRLATEMVAAHAPYLKGLNGPQGLVAHADKPAPEFYLDMSVEGSGDPSSGHSKVMLPHLVNICKEISHAMDMRVVAVPHKLNVYSAGGHFKKHVDTPIADPATHVGTLIVEVPTVDGFTGGDFTVGRTTVPRMPAPQEPASTEACSAPGEAAATADAGPIQQLHWVAFYADRDHQVNEVKSGHRVTMTYALVANAPDLEPTPDSLPAQVCHSGDKRTAVVKHARAVAEAIEQYWKERCAAGKDPVVGVLLENGHTFGALEGEVLKGFDAHLVRELREHTGFNVRLCPVGLSTGLDDWWEDTKPRIDLFDFCMSPGFSVNPIASTMSIMAACAQGFERKIEAWGSVYSFGVADIEAMRSDKVAPGPDPPLPSSDIPFLFSADEAKIRMPGEEPEYPGILLRKVYRPSVEWTGNESEEGYDEYQYVSGAAILTKDDTAVAAAIQELAARP